MNILVPDYEFKYSEQQIVGDECFIEKVEKRIVLTKETGYKMVEMGRVLKRDISVLSRLAKISETREGAKALQKERMRLIA